MLASSISSTADPFCPPGVRRFRGELLSSTIKASFPVFTGINRDFSLFLACIVGTKPIFCIEVSSLPGLVFAGAELRTGKIRVDLSCRAALFLSAGLCRNLLAPSKAVVYNQP